MLQFDTFWIFIVVVVGMALNMQSCVYCLQEGVFTGIWFVGAGFRYLKVALRCRVRLQTLTIEGTWWSNNFGYWHSLRVRCKFKTREYMCLKVRCKFLKAWCKLRQENTCPRKRKNKPPWEGKSISGCP